MGLPTSMLCLSTADAAALDVYLEGTLRWLHDFDINCPRKVN